jgi:hypothetical protein
MLFSGLHYRLILRELLVIFFMRDFAGLRASPADEAKAAAGDGPERSIQGNA